MIYQHILFTIQNILWCFILVGFEHSTLLGWINLMAQHTLHILSTMTKMPNVYEGQRAKFTNCPSVHTENTAGCFDCLSTSAVCLNLNDICHLDNTILSGKYFLL